MGNFIITNTKKFSKFGRFSLFVQYISQTRGSFAVESKSRHFLKISNA